MTHITNWGVVVSEKWGVPEKEWPQYLVGFVSGKYIMSDEISGIRAEDGYKVVTAGKMEYKVHRKEVDPKYETAWPGAYRNLK